MAQQVVTVGIDVSKPRLDVFVRPLGISFSVERDDAGLDELIERLAGHAITAAAVEASGGYERQVLRRLAAAGLPARRLNPLQVRRFAQAKGRRATNDRIDAEVIAHYAATFPDEGTVADDPALENLAEHLLFRSQTLEAITAGDNQLEHLRDRKLRITLDRRLAALRRCLARLDRRIARLLAGHPAHRHLDELLRAVPGVGPVLAASLIGLLPELGRRTRRQIASLAGVAPFDHDSGRRRGERSIDGGRAAVRKILYMAALVAKRRNPVIAEFAKRLHGKRPKVVIVACMRKLLVILNAMVRDNTTWQHA
jgi:transposase